MKQRIVFHVGMPRAGSSTLQEGMFFNRDVLAQSGIVYAVLQRSDTTDGRQGVEYNHRLLNGAAKGLLRPQRAFHPWMKGIIEGIRNRPDQITVLSYEGWWDPHNFRSLQRILQHLRKELPDADVELAAVVREPVSFLLSLYKLDVLHGRTQLSFTDHLAKALSDPRLRYGSISSALLGLADKATFLDFAALTAGGQFCGALLETMTGAELSKNPALSAFFRHRSGGTAYFSDAVITMLRFAASQLGLKTVQRHRQEIQDILLRLSRDPRMAQHCGELVIPLSRETVSRIGTASKPLVEDFYARHLPKADASFAAARDGQVQSEIAVGSPLGQEILDALSSISRVHQAQWRFGWRSAKNR